MAQTVQSGIVDLTGEDDNVDSFARANAACEKAFAAASRLTNHFESLKTPKPVGYKNPNRHLDLGEKNPLPASTSRPLFPPRPGTFFPGPTRFETNVLQKNEKKNAIPRRESLVPSPGVSFSQSSLGIAASKPAKFSSLLDGAEGKRGQPRETTSVTPMADSFTARTPRSAAVSAKQNIADTCNELEEWVNKDPNLIPQQVGVSTPRKPGRPKKDSDEWSPNSNIKNSVEERKELVRTIDYSPTPSIGKGEDLTTKEGKDLLPNKGISGFLSNRKRKHSASSQPSDSPVKSAKGNEEPKAYHDSALPTLDKPACGKHVRDETGNNSPAGVFPRCVYPALNAAKAAYKQILTENKLTGIGKSITNDITQQGVEAFCPASANCPKNQRTELILKSVSKAFHERALRVRGGSPVNLIASAEYSPKGVTVPLLERGLEASRLEHDSSNEEIGKMDKESPTQPLAANSVLNGASTEQADAGSFGQPEPSMLSTQEKIDPRLRQELRNTSGLITSEPTLSSSSTGHVVFTALLESVVYPAIRKSKKRHKTILPWEKLDAIGETIVNDVLKKLASHSDSQQLDEDTKKKIKRFVKKSFRQKVRKANTQSSHKSATPANDSTPYIAMLSPGSSDLEGMAETKTVPTEGHHHCTLGQSYSENVLSSRAVSANTNEDTRQPHPLPVNQQQPLSLQTSPNESPTSPFGPNFDRGRYPALRRRRGNKYYTPTRISKTTPKLKQTQPIPFDDHLHLRPGIGLSTGPTLTAPPSNQHSHALGVSNGKDQVRLLKALANQLPKPRASETQLTALTTAAENRRAPTNQRSALELLASIEEPTDMGPVAPESASYDDVSKEPQKAPARGQERMTAPGEILPGDSGRAYSPLAKPRKSTATYQSAQQAPRKRPLEDTDPPKEPRPVYCPKPATALDPSLEHVVAVLVTDTSSRPSKHRHGYSITPTNRMQLVANQSIVKHVDLTSQAENPKFVRIETKVIDPVRHPGRCISSLLRNRELGLGSRGRHGGTADELRQLRSEMIEPWKVWKGASGDVVAVAWSPDSNVYAFGAAAHTNVEDIQYNRPCNLLLGNLISNQIRELPDHRIDRPKPETIPSGPNATQAVYDACDPKVYETVTSIAFSSTGERMFTASHDCTVKVWDISPGKHQCVSTLRHEAWVTSVELSKHRQGLFATASKCVKDAVRIYWNAADPSCYVDYSASRAEARPDWKIYPECLRWGPSPYNSHLLLAGFQQWEQHGDLLSGGGQLCLWDAHAFQSIKVTPSSQSIYAAAWHPTEPFFATGGAPGNNVIDKINTKTVVRTWDVRKPKRCTVEYECPAVDMQDITFSPLNANVMTAGCTDGISYVWDWRWPDQPLHRLKHGRPLVDWDHTREREEADTGVMMSIWGPGGSLFYTGSSDGMINAWDVRRHPSDVLISNVANFNVSIQSGAFSPDGNNLLVGDAEGGIHVLSSAPCGPRSNLKSTDAYIDLVRTSDGSGLRLDQNNDNPGTEGIQAARSFIQSGQLEYHKELGVGQGPNYQGPYAKYARKEDGEAAVGRLRRKFEKKQPMSKRGEKRWDIAIPMTSLLHERKELLDREKDNGKKALDGPNEHQIKAIELSKGRETLRTSPSFFTREGAIAVDHPSSTSLVDSLAGETFRATVTDGKEDQVVEDNTISESEMVEENFWWARMGEEEIAQAKAGRVRY